MMWDLSSKWDWLKRSAAYDLHIQRLKQAAQERARIEMAERQAREGTTLQNIAMGGIKNLLDEKGQVRKEVDMTPSVIARLLEVGVKIERLTGEARISVGWWAGFSCPGVSSPPFSITILLLAQDDWRKKRLVLRNHEPSCMFKNLAG